MKQKFLLFVIFCGVTSLHAYNDEPACFRDLQVNFFRPDLVATALSLNKVSQSAWQPIQNQLIIQSAYVPRIIHDRAQSMGLQNPLEYPFNAPLATKLLWEVLYGVFTEVLQSSNVTSLNSGTVMTAENIQDMFEYIRLEQASNLDACLLPVQ